MVALDTAVLESPTDARFGERRSGGDAIARTLDGRVETFAASARDNAGGRPMDVLNTADTPANRDALDRLNEIMSGERGRGLARNLLLALAEWALERMGAHSATYIERWLLDSVELNTLRTAESPARRVLESFQCTRVPIRATPQPLPPRLDEHGFLNHSDLRKEYRSLCDRLKKWRRQRRRGRGLAIRDLVDLLPGTSSAEADQWMTMKPSEIARAYLVQRWRLNISSDALKKRLAQDDAKRTARFRRQLEEGGLRLSTFWSSPPRASSAPPVPRPRLR